MAIVPYDHGRARKQRMALGFGRLPTKKRLESEAVRVLRRIMRDEACAEASRVGAARTILEYATSDPVAEAFAMLHGSDEQALAWLKSKTEALEAKLAERNGGANSSDEREPVRR